MRTHLSLIASAIALSFSATAWAAPETLDISTGTSPFAGGATIELSSRTLSSFNLAGATLSAVPPILGPAIVGTPGNYTAATLGTMGTALSYDNVTGELLSLSTQFGYRVETSKLTGVTKGGWFEVNDLTIDFSQQRVEGTISGQTQDGVSVSYTGTLFNAPSMTYNPAEWAQGQYGLQLAGLVLTPEALGAMTDSLAASALLRAGMASTASDYGTMDVWLSSTLLGTPAMTFSAPAMAVAVPEPSTWALMGAGLAGLMLSSRRKILRAAR